MFRVKCDICEKTFSCQPSLKSHIKGIHSKIKDLDCPQCDRKFSRRGDLSHHIKAVHLKLRPFKCDVCANKTFAQKKGLTAHIRARHGEAKEDDKSPKSKEV